MKTLLTCVSLFLVGCGHATTKMDRELALKLADRPQVHVVNPAPTTVNVNINSQDSRDELLSRAQEIQRQRLESADETMSPEQLEQAQLAQTNCTEVPVYTFSGALVRYVRRCFGGK
jgi:hypothetical protein